MNVEVIGTWAGLVWNALNEADVLGTKQLKKITKLKEKELYAALGWLGRENKITIQENPEDEKELLITLVQE
ncbi:MAG: winged helix-turn-helix domain-containing protein [Bacteroidales bacterium]|nr:winged helix-turn-helix domain-containing protein [Bacteroidales bacterium]MBD5230207.1 winged helix-turn-helix domain-containing protein [Bacteroidales bacterium]MBD5258799.1 winged helix-turn-helix domain-containing protein [Barnesiella sp.]